MERLATLEAVEAEVWRQLARSTHDKHHAWRSPVLATATDDGADARTVILREVDADARVLRIFTDERAGKVAQVMSHPLGTVVMWSRALGWQLRCRVRLSVQSQGLAATSRWALVKLSPSSQDYLSALPPGAPLEGAAPALPTLPSPQPHFAIVEAQVLAIDWLELHRDGHRRAVFDAEGAHWVQP